MKLAVREMLSDELGIMPDYFHELTPMDLDRLGVDPLKLPEREKWVSYCNRELELPYEERTNICLIWLADNKPVGFSTADTIKFGVDAKMHLHVITADNRQQGIGTECVSRSAEFYFDVLKLNRLFCEPNAFNIAPNRALQKAGFKYLKTYETNPGYINYHQSVTRWVLEGQ